MNIQRLKKMGTFPVILVCVLMLCLDSTSNLFALAPPSAFSDAGEKDAPWNPRLTRRTLLRRAAMVAVGAMGMRWKTVAAQHPSEVVGPITQEQHDLFEQATGIVVDVFSRYYEALARLKDPTEAQVNLLFDQAMAQATQTLISLLSKEPELKDLKQTKNVYDVLFNKWLPQYFKRHGHAFMMRVSSAVIDGKSILVRQVALYAIEREETLVEQDLGLFRVEARVTALKHSVLPWVNAWTEHITEAEAWTIGDAIYFDMQYLRKEAADIWADRDRLRRSHMQNVALGPEDLVRNDARQPVFPTIIGALLYQEYTALFERGDEDAFIAAFIQRHLQSGLTHEMMHKHDVETGYWESLRFLGADAADAVMEARAYLMQWVLAANAHELLAQLLGLFPRATGVHAQASKTIVNMFLQSARLSPSKREEMVPAESWPALSRFFRYMPEPFPESSEGEVLLHHLIVFSRMDRAAIIELGQLGFHALTAEVERRRESSREPSIESQPSVLPTTPSTMPLVPTTPSTGVPSAGGALWLLSRPDGSRDDEVLSEVDVFGNHLFRSWMLGRHTMQVDFPALEGSTRRYTLAVEPRLLSMPWMDIRSELLAELTDQTQALNWKSLDPDSLVVSLSEKQLVVYVGFKGDRQDLIRYELSLRGDLNLSTENASPREYFVALLAMGEDALHHGQIPIYLGVPDFPLTGILERVREHAFHDPDREVQREAVHAWMQLAGAFIDFREYTELAAEFRRVAQGVEVDKVSVLRGWGELIRLRIESQGPHGDTADLVEDLLPYLDSQTEEIARTAREIVEAIVNPSMMPALSRQYRQSDVRARAAIARVLAEIWYHPYTVGTLLNALEDPAKEVQVAAEKSLNAVLLRYSQDPAKAGHLAETLKTMANSKSLPIRLRIRAIDIMAISGDARYVDILLPLLADPSVNRAAEDGLHVLGDKAIPRLRRIAGRFLPDSLVSIRTVMARRLLAQLERPRRRVWDSGDYLIVSPPVDSSL